MVGVLVGACLLVWSPSTARSSEASQDEPATAEQVQVDPPVPEITADPPPADPGRMRYFPPRFYAGGLFYLPKITYTKSRGWGLGGQVLYPFRWPSSDASVPACELNLKGRLTFKSQALAELEAILHPFSAPYEIRWKMSYRTLRENFYGIGPDTDLSSKEVFKPQSTRMYIEFFHSFPAGLKLGVRAEYEEVRLLQSEGVLAGRTIRGAYENEHSAGFGLVGTFDRRDHHRSPTKGYYVKSFALLFDEEFGSQYDFNNYSLDLRGYFSPRANHVLAVQFFTYAARGAPPFWRLAEMGGRPHSRGYRRGRYRDRVLIAAQIEHRAHLFWRVGLAAFVGIADVGPKAKQLELEHMKTSFGGGPRLRIGNVAKRVDVRLDVGFGDDTPRFYLSIGEAF